MWVTGVFAPAGLAVEHHNTSHCSQWCLSNDSHWEVLGVSRPVALMCYHTLTLIRFMFTVNSLYNVISGASIMMYFSIISYLHTLAYFSPNFLESYTCLRSMQIPTDFPKPRHRRAPPSIGALGGKRIGVATRVAPVER